MTNDKAKYVAKEDSISLFSVAKETALNKQWIKPCVPFPHKHINFSIQKMKQMCVNLDF